MFFEERAIFPDGAVEPGMQFDGPPPGAATPDMPRTRSTPSPRSTPTTSCSTATIRSPASRCASSLVVRDVREATEDEIEAGSVGSSGHGVLAVATPGPHLH